MTASRQSLKSSQINKIYKKHMDEQDGKIKKLEEELQ